MRRLSIHRRNAVALNTVTYMYAGASDDGWNSPVVDHNQPAPVPGELKISLKFKAPRNSTYHDSAAGPMGAGA